MVPNSPEETAAQAEKATTQRKLVKALTDQGVDQQLANSLVPLAMQTAPVSQYQKALIRQVTEDELPAGAITRLMRLSGYDAGLIRAVKNMLERFIDGSEVDITVDDLANLIKRADPVLVELQRSRNAQKPVGAMRGGIRTVLREYGIEGTTANNLATAVVQGHENGSLTELARIGRMARSSEDSCVSIADVSWQDAPNFRSAYGDAREISAWGRGIAWRVQTLVKMARLASRKNGNFVECGVDTGGTAKAVMSYLGDAAFENRKFYLFDTFKGLDQEQLTKEESRSSLIIDDRYPNVLEQVRANFVDKPYARIIPGSVPATLDQYEGGSVSYLHIDMNVTLPEVEALRFFWPLLDVGAPVIFDDYGFPHHAPQRKALDAVADEFGTEIMMLPTCQGLLFKH